MSNQPMENQAKAGLYKAKSLQIKNHGSAQMMDVEDVMRNGGGKICEKPEFAEDKAECCLYEFWHDTYLEGLWRAARCGKRPTHRDPPEKWG